jgi:hypothetical protein
MRKLFLLPILLLMCLVVGAQNKKVAVLGDSYSTFEGAIPKGNAIWYFKRNNPNQTDVNRVEQTWWAQLIERKGWELLMNNSYSGSTICNTGYNKEDYSDRSFTKRMDNLGGNPDIIFIFGATNDSWAHAPIGEFKYENITKDDLWSFRPAMAYMLAWMKEHYAQSDIYFLLNDGLSQEVTESSKLICQHYGVKCIELKGIDKMAGHPSIKGMKQIADQVDEAMHPLVTWDKHSLMMDGRRIVPVMGEVHYSRIPANEWQQEVRKMKEGGVTMIATYVFWNHVEEEEGIFRWDGQRDLRRFLEICRDEDVPVVLRLGPFCHGEVRNGGIPDWMFSKGCRMRDRNPVFLSYVEKLYRQIFSQVQGLQWKDGGPVIAAQFDNEYRGRGEYLMDLKRIAQKIGFDLPFYTRTGWPELATPVPFGEMLPLYGDYADGFWDRTLGETDGNYYKAFNFKAFRSSTAIATEQLGDQMAKVSKGDEDYPYFTCELGGGMMQAYHRRPYLYPKDAYSMAVVKLGSGSNLLGYYMYHGGTNPEGKTYLNENQRTLGTNYNDMPVKNYDFQAPLGEFGQKNAHYYLLRPLHLFMHDWGEKLAEMEASFPAPQDIKKGDDEQLRWAIRSKDGSGFIFVNNYERLQNLSEKSVALEACGVKLPKITVPAGCIAIFPVNIDGIRYATAQLVAQRDGKIYMMQIEGIPTTICLQSGKTLKNVKAKGLTKPVCQNIYLLTQQEAERLFLRDEQNVKTEKLAAEKVKEASSLRQITMGKQKVAEEPTDEDFEQAAVYRIKLPHAEAHSQFSTLNSQLIRISYQGDCARLYANGKLVADQFQYGRPMLYGLWRLPEECQELELRILPLQKGAPIYLPREADKTPGERLINVELTNEGL